MKIAVMSNKGGVGKTTISINIAYTLARKGKKVGLIDIDFHGPNLPIMLNIDIKKNRPKVTGQGIYPIEHKGVKIMSLALLMKEEDDPCLWSGATKREMVQQMFKSVIWENIEYFVIDCPPSLGDENLVVADLADKIIVVSTPHQASIYDIRKMLRFLGNKVKAIVFNMYDLFRLTDDITLPGFPRNRIYCVKFDRVLQIDPTFQVQEIERLVEEVILGE